MYSGNHFLDKLRWFGKVLNLGHFSLKRRAAIKPTDELSESGESKIAECYLNGKRGCCRVIAINSLPVLINQEFSKIPLDIVPYNSPLARLQELVQWSCIFAIHFNLIHLISKENLNRVPRPELVRNTISTYAYTCPFSN